MKKILWHGREVEGMFSGYDTLFVGSPKITFEEIVKYHDDLVFNQIYFGAGRCTNVNLKVVKKCLDKLGDDVIITIETDIRKLQRFKRLFNTRIVFIVTINNKNFSDKIKYMQIKIQNLNKRYLAIGSVNYDFDKVDLKTLKGKTYKGDRVLRYE